MQAAMGDLPLRARTVSISSMPTTTTSPSLPPAALAKEATYVKPREIIVRRSDSTRKPKRSPKTPSLPATSSSAHHHATRSDSAVLALPASKYNSTAQSARLSRHGSLSIGSARGQNVPSSLATEDFHYYLPTTSADPRYDVESVTSEESLDLDTNRFPKPVNSLDRSKANSVPSRLLPDHVVRPTSSVKMTPPTVESTLETMTPKSFRREAAILGSTAPRSPLTSRFSPHQLNLAEKDRSTPSATTFGFVFPPRHTQPTTSVQDAVDKLKELSTQTDTMHERYASLKAERQRIGNSILEKLRKAERGPDYADLLLDEQLALAAVLSSSDICVAKLKSLNCQREDAVAQLVAQMTKTETPPPIQPRRDSVTASPLSSPIPRKSSPANSSSTRSIDLSEPFAAELHRTSSARDRLSIRALQLAHSLSAAGSVSPAGQGVVGHRASHQAAGPVDEDFRTGDDGYRWAGNDDVDDDDFHHIPPAWQTQPDLAHDAASESLSDLSEPSSLRESTPRRMQKKAWDERYTVPSDREGTLGAGGVAMF